MKNILCHFVSSAFALLLGAPLCAQGGEDLDRLLEVVDATQVSTVSGLSQDIERLGSKEEVIALVRSRIAATSGAHRLAMCRALINFEEAGAARDWLVDLLRDRSTDVPIRVAAVGLLGVPEFSEDSESIAALRRMLQEELDPEVQLACAVSLYEISRNDRVDAVKTMRNWMLSSQREHRVRGALALARINNFEAARETLREIRDDPTPEGLLANAYLKWDEAQRYSQSANSRLTGEPKGSSLSAELDLIEEVYQQALKLHLIGEQYATPEGREQLLAAAARGILNLLDEHSTFFSSGQHERWIQELQRDYGGIGAYVDFQNDVFTITRPIYSGPAFRAGLQSGDQIHEVDSWSTLGVSDIQEIISHLKGPPGSKVNIKVYRRGWESTRDFDLQREMIVIPSVSTEMFAGRLGYIELLTFGKETARELFEAVVQLKGAGARALIVDLRYNTGGYLESAVDIVGMFVGDHKLVVKTEGRRPRDTQEYITQANGLQFDDAAALPMTVLINGSSASASEILTGCLHHYGRASIIGEHSYGKGSVQSQVGLDSRKPEPFFDRNGNDLYDQGEKFVDNNKNGKWDVGPFIKITTARYYLPNGESIHREYDKDGKLANRGGIKPDVPVKLLAFDLWKERELATLLDKTPKGEKNPFEKYLDSHYEVSRALMIKLAEGDDRDCDRYPDFEAFYESLETRLDKDDVRMFLRAQLRVRVSDDRKKTFPFAGNLILGDYQEDNQLQAAIVQLLEKFGEKTVDYPEYVQFPPVKLNTSEEEVAASRSAGRD